MTIQLKLAIKWQLTCQITHIQNLVNNSFELYIGTYLNLQQYLITTLRESLTKYIKKKCVYL